MIKKFIIMVVLGGLGYVGYLVWSNLTPSEKGVVSGKIGDVAKDAKKMAKQAADSLTGTAKDAIKDMDDSPRKSPKSKASKDEEAAPKAEAAEKAESDPPAESE